MVGEQLSYDCGGKIKGYAGCAVDNDVPIRFGDGFCAYCQYLASAGAYFRDARFVLREKLVVG